MTLEARCSNRNGWEIRATEPGHECVYLRDTAKWFATGLPDFVSKQEVREHVVKFYGATRVVVMECASGRCAS